MSCAGTIHRVEAEPMFTASVFSISANYFFPHQRYYDVGARPKSAVLTVYPPLPRVSHFQLYDISVKVVCRVCNFAFFRKM